MAMAQELPGGSGGGCRARVRRAWKKIMTWPQQGQRISALSGRDSTTPPARRSWRTRAGEMASAGENSRPGCPARPPAGCRSHGNSRHRSMYPCSGVTAMAPAPGGTPGGTGGTPVLPSSCRRTRVSRSGKWKGSTRAPRVVFRAARKTFTSPRSGKLILDPFATTVGAMAERQDSICAA